MRPEIVQHDNLYRGLFASDAVELREDGDAPAGAVMEGHFSVFDTFTEIHSWYEGDFMERISRGAFAKTFAENLDNVRVQFDHGQDPHVGSAPLGPIREVREESFGAYYAVDLLDTDYNRNRILPLLEGRLLSGEKTGSLLGASFRFQVTREDWVDEPGPSDHNPKGLSERTIKEVKLAEFGPVVNPAYDSATAGVRSMTDHYLDRIRSRRDPAADHGTGDRQPVAPPPVAPDEQQAGAPTVAAARIKLLTLKGSK